MRIGLDLDNTLICYDQSFLQVGKEEGLLPASFVGNKPAIKQALLAERPDGYLWEVLQGLVYGRRIDAALLFEGVGDFLAEGRRRGAEVLVISHKTEFAHHDPLATNLRDAALRWMEGSGLFDLGLERGNVHFEPTRDDKVRRIGVQGCVWFVDDLAEVLTHHAMPAGCGKILFGGAPHDGLLHCPTWRDVSHAIFRPR
ncbi:MAG: hypothetical protein U1E60_01030 [Reyranellaceae bacterium]